MQMWFGMQCPNKDTFQSKFARHVADAGVVLMFPKTWGKHGHIELHQRSPDIVVEHQADTETLEPMRVGVVFSGGPAPGGHNVISGIYGIVTCASANTREM